MYESIVSGGIFRLGASCLYVHLDAMLLSDVITALHSGSFQGTSSLQEMAQLLKELDYTL